MSYDRSYGEMTVVPSMSYALEKQDKNRDILTYDRNEFYNTGPRALILTANTLQIIAKIHFNARPIILNNEHRSVITPQK